MIELLETLIQALRDELQQYGEMLARLDQQQESILRRAASDVVANANAVQHQSEVILQTRRVREAAQRRLAQLIHNHDEGSIAHLSKDLPAEYRPLLRALVEENNELLIRVQQRARQNHLLLRRAVDLMNNLLQNLTTEGTSTVYTGSGDTTSPSFPRCVIYEAAG
jgi:hypothetical protein